MQEPGANSQHTEAIGHRGRRQGCLTDGLGWGSLMGVAWLLISPFDTLLSPHMSTAAWK
jgi:hypothetical protein